MVRYVCPLCEEEKSTRRAMAAHARYCKYRVDLDRGNDSSASEEAGAIKEKNDNNSVGTGGGGDSGGEGPNERPNKYAKKNDGEYITIDSIMWNEIWLADFCYRHELSEHAGQELVDWIKKVRILFF